jgi:hypothetical protein
LLLKGVAEGHELIDFGDDAVLLWQWGERECGSSKILLCDLIDRHSIHFIYHLSEQRRIDEAKQKRIDSTPKYRHECAKGHFLW